MSGVKRYSALETLLALRQSYASPNTVELVLASDYDQLAANYKHSNKLYSRVARERDQLAAENKRLEDEVVRLREALDNADNLITSMCAALSTTANGEGVE